MFIKHQAKMYHPSINKEIYKIHKRLQDLSELNMWISILKKLQWPDLEQIDIYPDSNYKRIVVHVKRNTTNYGNFYDNNTEKEISFIEFVMEHLAVLRKEFNITFRKSYNDFISVIPHTKITIIISAQLNVSCKIIKLPTKKIVEDTVHLCGDAAIVWEETGIVVKTL